jgi:plastocyanin
MAAMRVCSALVIATLSLVADTSRVGDAQGSTGTVTGSVKLTAAKTTPLAVSPYGQRGVAPRPAAREAEIKNVIVYVQGLKPSAPPPAERARVTQRGEQFLPQVTAMTAGSTVDFPNDDPFFHNVFSLSKAKTFDLGRYPSGTSRSEVFNQAGVVKVFCHLHSHMTALIMVFDHPWFAIPSDSGAFSLPPVPVGELTLVAWHERIGERRERVMVAPGATVRMSFTLPVLESEP